MTSCLLVDEAKVRRNVDRLRGHLAAHRTPLRPHVKTAELDRVLALRRRGVDPRVAGHACPVVSVGSTPTAHAAADPTGVTEVRAGDFGFFDLVVAGTGVCAVVDLALSAVVTVIGHRPARIMTDGGREHGTYRLAGDAGTTWKRVNGW